MTPKELPQNCKNGLNGKGADTVISPANNQRFMAPSQTATTQLPIVGSVLWSKCIPGRDVWQCCAGHIRRQTTVCKHTWTLWLKLQTIPLNLYPSRHYMWSLCPSLLHIFTLKVFHEPHVEVVCIRTQRNPTGTYMSSFTNIRLPLVSWLHSMI